MGPYLLSPKDKTQTERFCIRWQASLVIYRQFVNRNATSMNFDNPVYRKTTEDQFALQKNLHHNHHSVRVAYIFVSHSNHVDSWQNWLSIQFICWVTVESDGFFFFFYSVNHTI